jgi:glutamine kinase
MLLNHSKAENLKLLLEEGYNVPYVLYFKVSEWENNKDAIINNCIGKIMSEKLAIRSSSISEDTEENSNAGAYDSVLNVANNHDNILTAVEKVISSYEYSPENQVLIQPMVESVAMSGVVMTKTLDDGSPYYVVNFDDTSGKTDTVTSGNSINKTVYIYNGAKESDFDSPYLLAVIKLVWQLEKHFLNTPLDIEFAVDTNLIVHLLQVRKITVSHKWKTESNQLVNERIYFLSEYLDNILQPRLGLLGEKTLLGLMPDWNPAEMIGVVPRPLAMSLYRTLITKVLGELQGRKWDISHYRQLN